MQIAHAKIKDFLERYVSRAKTGRLKSEPTSALRRYTRRTRSPGGAQ